jgi:anti-sigma factor RsiW
MTEHITDNHDALLDYLYEEGDPAERLKIAQHLQQCAPCSVAVLEFQNVRGMLRGWTPPAADLGFRVVRDGAAATPTAAEARESRREWWRAWTPVPSQARWVQAAAAMLLFAAGLGVSQLNMAYQDGALTVRLRPAEAVPMPASQNARRASIALTPDPRVESDSGSMTLVSNPSSQNAPNVDVEQLLQRVRAMIDQSEQRQQRELALRLSQAATEVETQHQADLLRIQQSLGQQQEEVMNYLVRTAGGPK